MVSTSHGIQSDLTERLRRARLLTSDQLKELIETGVAVASQADFDKFCVERGWLTEYQLEHLHADTLESLALGGYRLLEPIGAGGMGEVFRALQLKLNRHVAVKLIRSDFATDHGDAQERFRREALAVARLSHPNIVTIFDADHSGGTHYIAMEYVSGKDLTRLVLERGRMSSIVACDYIRQAALGLQHLLENGLVHRDIKPSNLLVAFGNSTGNPIPGDHSNGLLKILDLGLARVNSDLTDDCSLTRDRGMMGTPDYISPEQARNSKRADIRSDIYSLGCTFYFLLAGQVPFPNGTAIEKVLCHQLERPRSLLEIRPDLSPDVVNIVRKMMAKRPEDRYQTPAEVAQALAVHMCIQRGVNWASATPAGNVDQARAEVVPPTMVTEVPKFAAPKEPPHANLLEKTFLPVDTPSMPESSPPAEANSTIAFHVVKTTVDAMTTCVTINWSGTPARHVADLHGHASPVVSLAFSPRGPFLASGSVDNNVRVWTLDGGKFRQATAFHDSRLGEIQELLFSTQDSSLLVSANGLGGRIWYWRWQDEQEGEMVSLTGSGRAPLVLSPDGKLLVAAGVGEIAGEIQVWSVRDNVAKICYAMAGHNAVITAAMFSQDGKSFFSGYTDGRVQLWKSVWGKFRPKREILAHVGSITGLAGSPCGQLLATAGTDNALRIWSLEGKAEQIQTISTDLRGVVRSVQFLSDRPQLLTITDLGQVATWKIADGGKESEWRLNQVVYCSQAYDSGRNLVAVGRTDGIISVYELATFTDSMSRGTVVSSTPLLALSND